jgi:hypothetical protein
MKQIEVVLHHKQRELETVRRQVEALRTIIPLLLEEECHPEDFAQMVSSIFTQSQAATQSRETMNDLETYYPFIRKIRAKTVSDSR